MVSMIITAIISNVARNCAIAAEDVVADGSGVIVNCPVELLPDDPDGDGVIGHRLGKGLGEGIGEGIGEDEMLMVWLA